MFPGKGERLGRRRNARTGYYETGIRQPAEIVPADGAFYLYVDVSRFTNDSLAFAKLMLDEAGVAATPGVDFDEGRGRRFMRFSRAATSVVSHPPSVRPW